MNKLKSQVCYSNLKFFNLKLKNFNSSNQFYQLFFYKIKIFWQKWFYFLKVSLGLGTASLQWPPTRWPYFVRAANKSKIYKPRPVPFGCRLRVEPPAIQGEAQKNYLTPDYIVSRQQIRSNRTRKQNINQYKDTRLFFEKKDGLTISNRESIPTTPLLQLLALSSEKQTLLKDTVVSDTVPLQSQDPNCRVIVITSGKGGVGKTTATANLGMSIARLGYRVALIDSDIGLRNLDLLLGLENRIMYTAMDILEGQCRLDQALIRDKRWKNLSLLSISKNRQRYNVTRKHMDNLISSISSLGYHFVLIDCPAGIDVGFINAISPAQEALIVTTPEITAIRDADRVAGLLEANGIYNTKLLVNRVRPDMVQRNDMMSVRDVQEMLGIPLLGVIPEDTHVIISTNRGEPLVLKKKLTLSGIAFENAARRLIGKQDYFIDLSAPYKGIFQKVHDLIVGK